MGNTCSIFTFENNAALAVNQRAVSQDGEGGRQPRAGTFSLLRMCSATSAVS